MSTTFIHVINNVTLVCELDYEAGERSTRDDPGEQETADLVSACTLKGETVTGLLDEDQCAEIEHAFLNQTEEV